MSETLSALIAFVGFLIVFSMLIQSVQESLKNLFKLKAGVWERFFINMYETEMSADKGFNVTPFWTRVAKGQFVGEFEKRIQRLKTIVIEADNLFGNLKTRLMKIEEIDPSTPEGMKNLNIRIGELIDDIKKITGLKIDTLLRIYDQGNQMIIKSYYQELQEFLIKIAADKTLKPADVQMPATEIRKYAVKLLENLTQVEVKISDYRLQIENKADAWIAQVNGEYKRNMLKWTVFIGVVFVVVFNADSFSIYKHLAFSSKAQSVLVEKAAEATTMVQKSDSEDLNKIEVAIKGGDFSKAKNIIMELSKKLKDDFEAYGAEHTVRKTDDFIAETGKIENDIEMLKIQYGKLTRLYLNLQKNSVDFQLKGLTSAELPIGWSQDWGELKDEQGEMFVLLIARKIGGLALTVFLISFGAPFWKDILNLLAGIRDVSTKKR